MWRAVLVACLAAAGSQQARPNRVVSISSTCDKAGIHVKLEVEQPFKGLIFSKDFSRECQVQGNFQTKISIHLPSNGCGVRTATLNSTGAEPDDEEDLYYTVELVVQMDRHLQQFSDQDILVRFPCDPVRKEIWSRIIRKQRNEPYFKPHNSTRVCSAHFFDYDVYISKAGLRRLKRSAIPRIDIEVCKNAEVQPSVSAQRSHVEEIDVDISDLNSVFDTPRKIKLKKRIIKLEKHQSIVAKKIKNLQKQNIRLKKKNKSLQDIVKHLKHKNYITEQIESALEKKAELAELYRLQMIKNKYSKHTNKVTKTKRPSYSPALRKFAMTLNFYSPSAYKYVRRKFDCCLPHPRTITKWCKLQPQAVRISSSALEGVISTKIREMNGHEMKRMRSGRNRQGWMSPAEAEQRELLMDSARAWMELAPATGAAGAEPVTVEVGQPTRLLIQCTLPVGVGLRVTNCVAHDGLGEASQKLLDEAGCSVDDTIFNKPTVHHHKHRSSEIDFSDLEPADLQRNIEENTNLKLAKSDPEYMLKNIMAYQHAITTFAAFKFPDRAKLHLTCGIELCKGHCPVVDCKALQKPQQTRDGLVRKARLDKDAKGLVIDRLEVFNSIEVLAPNIELEDEASIRGSRRIVSEEEDFVRGFSPGDKTICLSPGKMALAFCVLGVIFLCAIAVAFASLVRARRRGREPLHTSLSFYTGSKSLFSSSESSSSGLSGSKLLLTDSPYLDQHSSSSNNWPYSRAF